MMIPGQVTLIPVCMLVYRFNWLATLPTFIFPVIGAPDAPVLTPTQSGDGLPGLCPLPAHVGAGKPGLRAGHISGSNGRDPNGSGIQVRVRPTFVEMLGEYILAYFEFGGALLTAKLDPEVDCRVNETIELTLNLDKMHLFEPATGQVIPPSDKT